MGKPVHELERMLKNDEVIELKLTERTTAKKPPKEQLVIA